MTDKPTILITGFSEFPGAPNNPTQHLISLFRKRNGEVADQADIHAHVLRTEYATAAERLRALAAEIKPDIALHFGLHAEAGGFKLERWARNVIDCDREDVAGLLPNQDVIEPQGAQQLQTGLPVLALFEALQGFNLPVEISDDAGGYLCNYVFYVARTRADQGDHPAMSGFIHVPLLDTQTGDEPLVSLTEDQLWRGALACVEICAQAWQAQSHDT